MKSGNLADHVCIVEDGQSTPATGVDPLAMLIKQAIPKEDDRIKYKHDLQKRVGELLEKQARRVSMGILANLEAGIEPSKITSLVPWMTQEEHSILVSVLDELMPADDALQFIFKSTQWHSLVNQFLANATTLLQQLLSESEHCKQQTKIVRVPSILGPDGRKLQ